LFETFALRGAKAPVRRCLSLAIFEVELVARCKNRKTNPNSTDLPLLAEREAVTAHQDCLDLMSVDKLISWINANRESVSLRQVELRKQQDPHGASGTVRAKKFN
jgi:hypothetical protein